MPLAGSAAGISSARKRAALARRTTARAGIRCGSRLKTSPSQNRETMRSKTRTTKVRKAIGAEQCRRLEARRRSGSRRHHPRQRDIRERAAVQEPDHDRLFDHPDRRDHAGGQPLQAADRHAQEEHRQEDRILYADLVCVGGRGYAQRLGPARRPRAGILRDRQSKARGTSKSSRPTPRTKAICRRKGRATASILITTKASGLRQQRQSSRARCSDWSSPPAPRAT